MLVVPLLSGLSGNGIRRTTIFSGLVALVGVGLLESGGSAAFNSGDLWNFASAIAFGIQARLCTTCISDILIEPDQEAIWITAAHCCQNTSR